MGISTPLRDHERPGPELLNDSDAKRVSLPNSAAANWSSEIVLRNPALLGCGADVRYDLYEAWPPPDFRMRCPRNDRELVAKISEQLQVGWQFIIAPRLFRNDVGGVQAQTNIDRNDASSLRRGWGGRCRGFKQGQG